MKCFRAALPGQVPDPSAASQVGSGQGMLSHTSTVTSMAGQVACRAVSRRHHALVVQMRRGPRGPLLCLFIGVCDVVQPMTLRSNYLPAHFQEAETSSEETMLQLSCHIDKCESLRCHMRGRLDSADHPHTQPSVC